MENIFDTPRTWIPVFNNEILRPASGLKWVHVAGLVPFVEYDNQSITTVHQLLSTVR